MSLMKRKHKMIILLLLLNIFIYFYLSLLLLFITVYYYLSLLLHYYYYGWTWTELAEGIWRCSNDWRWSPSTSTHWQRRRPPGWRAPPGRGGHRRPRPCRSGFPEWWACRRTPRPGRTEPGWPGGCAWRWHSPVAGYVCWWGLAGTSNSQRIPTWRTECTWWSKRWCWAPAGSTAACSPNQCAGTEEGRKERRGGWWWRPPPGGSQSGWLWAGPSRNPEDVPGNGPWGKHGALKKAGRIRSTCFLWFFWKSLSLCLWSNVYL